MTESKIVMTPKGRRRVPDKKIARSATARGQLIRQVVFCWIRRWGFTSNQCLSYLYPARPLLASDLARRGWLIRHDQPHDVRFSDGRTVFSLSPEAEAVTEAHLPSFILNVEHSLRPNWMRMQHLMICQRVALALGMLPESVDWKTEPESRVTAPDDASLIQDMGAMMYDENQRPIGGRWIEVDLSPKRDQQLDYWTQQLSEHVSLVNQNPAPEGRIARITVAVTSDYQVNRYQRFFSREYADALIRDRVSRKITEAHRDTPRIPIASVLSDLIEITRIEDILAHPEMEHEERAQLVGLGR